MDVVFLALRVVVSLGAVLGAIWLLHRWLTKGTKSPARRAGKAVVVVARQSLGAKASVAVIETEGGRFLLGVTEQAITVLDRIDIAPAQADTATAPTTVVEIPAATAIATAHAVEDFARADYARAEESARAASPTIEGSTGTRPVILPAPPGVRSHVVTSQAPRPQPSSVVSFEQALNDARAAGARQEVDAELSAAEIRRPLTAPIPLLPATRRALREAEAASAARRPAAKKPAAGRDAGAAREKKSPIAGSILSPDTWRQTAEALRRAR